MLNNVTQGLNRMARNVIRNHPNAYNCKVYRKEVLRQSDSTFNGKPTMGGLGMLDTDDEPDYQYVWLGWGYALPAEGFAPSPMMDRNDANTGPSDEFRFLIEPDQPSGAEGSFELRTHDIVTIVLGDLDNPAELALEIVGRETINNIPPYSVRYVCNRRSDFDLAPGRVPLRKFLNDMKKEGKL